MAGVPLTTARIPQRWWETVSAMTRPHLKSGGRTLRDLVADLGRIKSLGIDAIEVFAPCAGGTCYNGLDTLDFYRVDPAIGTLADLEHLVSEAHRRGIAIVLFLNLGYGHEYFPAFVKACDDVRRGIDSAERRMFVWSDDGRETLERPLAPFFLQDAHGNWRWSERAQAYFWVKWEGERGGYHLPQFNFGDPGWQDEVRRILAFWLATGVDGVVIDAVNWYINCDWTITRATMTDVIDTFPNQFSQPEGAGGFQDDPVPWIVEGGFNCVMDYSIKLWWEGKDLVRDAIASGDPRPIEAALCAYRDRVVAAGGVCYINPSYVPDAPLAAQLLAAAVVATVGELWLDVEHTYAEWSEEYRVGVMPLLEARRRYPALGASGVRVRVATSDDARYYAFLRTQQGAGAPVLVLLNFQAEPQTITVDLTGHNVRELVHIWSGECYTVETEFVVSLPAYGFAIYVTESDVVVPACSVVAPISTAAS